MENKYIQFNGQEITVENFIIDQEKFITDADILLGGFQMILKNDKNVGINFLTKLNTLHKQILYRIDFIESISHEYEIESNIIYSLKGHIQIIEELLLMFSKKDKTVVV